MRKLRTESSSNSSVHQTTSKMRTITIWHKKTNSAGLSVIIMYNSEKQENNRPCLSRPRQEKKTFCELMCLQCPTAGSSEELQDTTGATDTTTHVPFHAPWIQISPSCSEKLLVNQRPKAASDKSLVYGVCLCLLKKLRDLSPSSPLCRDDTQSFQASRWPFVCDDLLISFSRPPA